MFCFGPTLPHQHLPIISHHPRLFFLSSPVFTKQFSSPNPTLRCSNIFYDMSHGFHPHHRINKTAPETAASAAPPVPRKTLVVAPPGLRCTAPLGGLQHLLRRSDIGVCYVIFRVENHQTMRHFLRHSRLSMCFIL